MISDRSGTIDLPVKLAVCFLIIGAMMPILADSVEKANENIGTDRVMEEAIGIRDAIYRTYYSGGTVMSVDIELGPGCSIALGGDGTERYMMRLIVDGEISETIYLDSPPTPVLNSETILSGEMTVRMQALQDESGLYGVRLLT